MCKLQDNTVVRVNYHLVFMPKNIFPLNIKPTKKQANDDWENKLPNL